MYTCIHYTPSGIRLAFPATQLHTSALALISDEKSFFNIRNQSTETTKTKGDKLYCLQEKNLKRNYIRRERKKSLKYT
jgi:hypothetical protein